MLRPFYLQLRDTTDFKWTPEWQETFDKVKKELMSGTLRLGIQKNLSIAFATLPAMVLELHFYKKINLGKWN